MDCPPAERLLGELDAEIEAHIDGCASCRQAMSAIARGDEPAPSFGRYRLDTVIGSGGMGIVYRAYDPQLARAVAIKVVKRVGDDPAAGTRLAREAQSLARLSHRHVCQVYDVGTEGDEVWVAMELIDGSTLRTWAIGRPRAALVDVLLAAAEGLAAAHAAGVIHRDVKPENVLITRDGRAVVSDFGLARLEEMAPARDSDPNVTGAGAIAGTPAYLAPEQLARAPVDARVDQFAWGVMAWELLVGKRPFPVALEERAEAVRAGVAAPPGLPRALGAVLVRALAADPAARFASMTELVDSFRRSQRRSRAIRRYGAAGAITVALAGTAFFVRGHDDPAAECERGAARIDGVWNPARADGMKRAFVATGKSFAADSAERAIAQLDDFRTRFTTETGDACRATFSRGEASQKAFDLRKACLDHGLERVDQLLQLFDKADGEIVTHAVNAVHAVTDLDACRDVPLMLARVDEPTDPRVRAKLADLRTKLARADALDVAGEAKQSLAAAREIEPAVNAIDYAPLRAEVAYRIGVELRDVGTFDEAETAFQQAVTAAEAGRDDELAAYAWVRMASLSRARDQFDEAGRRIEQAKAKLARLGDPPEPHAFYMVNRAMIEHAHGDLAAARADYEHGIAEWEKLGAERPRVVAAMTSLAKLYDDLGLDDKYLATAERAEAIAEKIRGPNHPLTADALDVLGTALGRDGKHRQAISAIERALAIRTAVYGARSNQVAGTLNGLAGELVAVDDAAGAEAKLLEALSIRTELYGPDHSATLGLERNLANLLASTRPKDALPHIQHTLEVTLKVKGADSVDAGMSYFQLGTAQGRLHDFPAARANLAKARDILIGKLGPNHPRVAMVLSTIGRVEGDAGQNAAAIAALSQAVGITDKGQRDPTDAANDRLELGRLLWPSDHARALALVTAARDGFAKIEGGDKDRAEADAWLAAHTK